ncbi:MAG TPA: hypothetical protein VNJ51_07270 [Candidatus Dormibacteraeota bacterium]|nr:hypothetical protein [Candidatus Dormibacteraeota bacterium]
MLEEESASVSPIASELSDQVLENARLLAERRLSRTLNALPLAERAKRVADHVRHVGRRIAREVERLAPGLVEVEERAVRCAETGRAIAVLVDGERVVIERSWLTGRQRRQAVEEIQVDDDLLYVRLSEGGGEWASIWELVGEILEE